MLLPTGVRQLELEPHLDVRGDLHEVFRGEWDTGMDDPLQWNVARNHRGALRGVHVHAFHDDLIVLLQGRAWLGVKDLRRGSRTEGLACLLELSTERISAVTVPRGILHGTVHLEPTVLLVGVSEYHGNPLDELGCRWDDPALGLDWPVQPTLMSHRDRTAPSLATLLEQLEPWQPIGAARIGAGAHAAAR